MIGTTVYEYSDPEHHETIRRSIAEVFRTGQPGGYEIRGMGVDGAPTWYRCAVAPLMEDGRVRAVMVTSNDITERRNMEEKLRESEEQFRSLVENAPDFISTFGADGRIWFLNRAAPGHDVSMFIGRNAYEFIPPADQARVRGMLDQVFGSGATVTYETGWKVGGGAGPVVSLPRRAHAQERLRRRGARRLDRHHRVPEGRAGAQALAGAAPAAVAPA